MFCLALAAFAAGGFGVRADDEVLFSKPLKSQSGRVAEITVPVRESGFYLGDVNVRVYPDQTVYVDATQLARAVAKVLGPEAAAILKPLQGADSAVPIEAVRAAGIDIRYDPNKVELTLSPLIDQRARNTIAVQGLRESIISESTAPPARLSGYINARVGVDYVAREDDRESGIDAPRIDLEAAIRLRGIVLEGEGTLEGDRFLLDRPGEAEGGFKRRGTRLVYDLPGEAIRLRAGDVDTREVAFQRGANMLGLSAQKNYQLLQPGRNIRPTGSRSFRLERPATVEVVVDGVVVRRLRLQPGEHDLSELNTRPGASTVTLNIEDDTGQRRKLEFTLFGGRTLLAAGLSEWAATAGFRSTIDEDSELSYDLNSPLASVFYRLGITDWLTGEAHAQGDKHSAMGGVGVAYESGIGVFGAGLAVSNHAVEGFGYALNADYEIANLRDGHGWRHTLRLFAEHKSANFATLTPSPTFVPRHDIRLDVGAHYSRTLPFDLTGAVSLRYGLSRGDGEPNRLGVGLSLNRPLTPETSVSLAVNYDEGSKSYDDGFSGMLRLNWRPSERSFVDVSHDTRRGTTRASYTRYEGEGVGSWNANVHVEGQTEDAQLTAGGSLGYTGNRGRATVSHYALATDLKPSRLAGTIVENRTSFRFETALAFADGKFAMGRPITNGFAIIDTHDTLGDKAATIGASLDVVQARSDGFGPALVPEISAYAMTRLPYDVPELPIGYDLGAGAFDLHAPYRAGYALEIGSAYTVTAHGRLLGEDGEPLALITGRATQHGKTGGPAVEVFTNRVGRFGAQGLAPGRWIIVMATSPETTYVLDVPAKTVGLFNAGSLKPARR